MLFVESKWLYNDILTFTNSHNINEYNYKVRTVKGLDKDKNPVDLQQHGVTYKFIDENHVHIQGMSKALKVEGSKQIFKNPEIETANAKLLNLPDGYYIAVTTFQNKRGEQRKHKSEIGIDMGIKTSITTSEGQKIKVYVEEAERLKKLQRKIMRRKKGSGNRYKIRKLLRKEYQKLQNKKQDKANKIVHELLEHEIIYMQDENLKGWHKGLFGKKIQHSVLGTVKQKLMKNERVKVLSKSVPTTKYCPNCGKINKDIKLSDRIFECSCGYKKDRDVHAACNMILMYKNTCGTQEINAFGEDVRREQKCCNADLVELGSRHFYKWR